MQIGANAILFTCSAFGDAIEAVAKTVPIPVLKPNETMFDEALASARTVGLLTTFHELTHRFDPSSTL